MSEPLLMTRSHEPLVHKVKTKLTRGGIKKVSDKRIKLNKIYSRLRKRMLEKHPICQHWLAENGWIEQDGYYDNPRLGVMRCSAGWIAHKYGAPASSECHHRKGRGRFFLDTTTWMMVRTGHEVYIHTDPKRYEKGYCLLRR